MVPMSLPPPRNQELVLAAHSQLKRRSTPNSGWLQPPLASCARTEWACGRCSACCSASSRWRGSLGWPPPSLPRRATGGATAEGALPRPALPARGARERAGRLRPGGPERGAHPTGRRSVLLAGLHPVEQVLPGVARVPAKALASPLGRPVLLGFRQGAQALDLLRQPPGHLRQVALGKRPLHPSVHRKRIEPVQRHQRGAAGDLGADAGEAVQPLASRSAPAP